MYVSPPDEGFWEAAADTRGEAAILRGRDRTDDTLAALSSCEERVLSTVLLASSRFQSTGAALVRQHVRTEVTHAVPRLADHSTLLRQGRTSKNSLARSRLTLSKLTSLLMLL